DQRLQQRRAGLADDREDVRSFSVRESAALVALARQGRRAQPGRMAGAAANATGAGATKARGAATTPALPILALRELQREPGLRGRRSQTRQRAFQQLDRDRDTARLRHRPAAKYGQRRGIDRNQFRQRGFHGRGRGDEREGGEDSQDRNGQG